MPKKKAKGKKKGKKVPAGPPIITTRDILHERTKMNCPRMGDSYSKMINVETILGDVASKTIEKVVAKQSELLNLKAMKLSQLPVFSPTQLTYLNCVVEVNLSKNNLFNLEEIFNALSLMYSLKCVDLSHNYLNGEMPDIAGDLNLLEELRLDTNHITSLPATVAHWTHLKVLTASGNSLTELPFEASAWTRLTYINCKNNKIRSLGSVVRYWTQLEKISFGSNLLNCIPEEISYCPKIIEADFSYNVITQLPYGLTACTGLEILLLGSNQLAEIHPDLFIRCSNLVELMLYRNKLGSIPREVGNLQNLVKLSIASNSIHSLPDEIGECLALKELYLNNNAKLSHLPNSTGHLRRLQELALRKCPALKQLPTSTSDCKQLRELDLRAAKKQTCKISSDMVQILADQQCVIRGGVVKKTKAPKAKKSK